jgi:hypothetical protein
MKFNPEGRQVPQIRQVPKEFREELVWDIHEHPLHSHQGIMKTLKRL